MIGDDSDDLDEVQVKAKKIDTTLDPVLVRVQRIPEPMQEIVVQAKRIPWWVWGIAGGALALVFLNLKGSRTHGSRQ